MKFATDFDGVILDFKTMLIKGIKKRTNIDVSKYMKGVMVHHPNIDEQTIRKLVKEILLEDTPSAKPIKATIKTLEKIYKLYNEPIIIVTNRSEDLHKVTEDWLDQNVSNKFEWEIRYGSGKIYDSKVEYLKDANWYLDDILEQLVSVCSLPNIRRCFWYNQDVYDMSNMDKKIIKVSDINRVYDIIR